MVTNVSAASQNHHNESNGAVFIIENQKERQLSQDPLLFFATDHRQ